LNISFETLRKLRSWKKGKYGDLIINYPNISLNRAWENKHYNKINSFFGKNMENIPKER